MLKNKKGLISSTIVIMLVVFTFVISMAMGYIMWIEANAVFQSLDEDIADNTTKAKIDDMTNIFLKMDKVFIFLFTALWIGLIVTSIQLPVRHPLFFFIYLLFLGIVTILAVVIREILSKMLTVGILEQFTIDFPIMTFYSANLHYISIVIALISGVVFYSRAGQTGQGGGNVP